MKRFWDWVKDEDGGRVLRLEGPIDEDLFWGDEITPKAFRKELESDFGDITVWINSPGGNVLAAAEIYTMLRDYKGAVTVKIDALAASAASVVAMAGNRVLMSPVGMIMVHDPSTIAMGNAKEMEKAINTLNEVKESIINAYAYKSGLSRRKISQLMEDETWLNAKKAVEFGFADEILFEGKDAAKDEETQEDEDDGKAEEMEEPEEADQPEPKEEDDDDGKIHLKARMYSTRRMQLAFLNSLAVRDDASKGTIPARTEPTPERDEGQPSGTDDASGEVQAAESSADSDEPSEAKEGNAKGDEDEDRSETDPGNPDGKPPEGKSPKGKSPEDKTPKDRAADSPAIGLDGKTKDGSMPFDILMNQLEWMR